MPQIWPPGSGSGPVLDYQLALRHSPPVFDPKVPSQAAQPGRVVVIGAGARGLAAAYHAAAGGGEVTLVEAAPRIGGIRFPRVSRIARLLYGLLAFVWSRRERWDALETQSALAALATGVPR